ncbi:hypothetical protein BJV78DRAFT_1286613 [Lactifluus subvellereus]|nr:hypothetical protein BJV78DRAFT_1286613 [Lactifluus subvellereus]
MLKEHFRLVPTGATSVPRMLDETGRALLHVYALGWAITGTHGVLAVTMTYWRGGSSSEEAEESEAEEEEKKKMEELEEGEERGDESVP